MESLSTSEIDLMTRRSNGVEIVLLWHRQSNIVSIAINDLNSGELQSFSVPQAEAMLAFTHPFVYLAEMSKHEQ